MQGPAVTYKIVDELVENFKGHKCSFILSPKQWQSFNITTKLQWKKCRLVDSNVNKVPETRGVYAHSIIYNSSIFPITSYITYVGLVGDTKTTGTKGNRRNLRQRFREYLKEKEKGRPIVRDMLKRYDGYIWFHYVEIPDVNVRLTTIETALLDAILPPCNIEDFSINIKQAHQIATRG